MNLPIDDLDSILHLNGCQQRTAGWNEAKAGNDLDFKDMERLEKTTLTEVNKIVEAREQNLLRKLAFHTGYTYSELKKFSEAKDE